MQHMKVRQRKDGRYDFTTTLHGKVVPAGYCTGWINWPKDWQERLPVKYAAYVEQRDKYHTEGHETPEEAAECYRQYVLDRELRLNISDTGTWRQCQVCGELTELRARTSWGVFVLCESHQARAHVEPLLEIDADTEIWES